MITEGVLLIISCTILMKKPCTTGFVFCNVNICDYAAGAAVE